MPSRPSEQIYNQLDDVVQRNLGLDVNKVFLTSGIDEHTGRLTSFEATPYGKADVYKLGYAYDPAGNILGIRDQPDGGQATEQQCFTYDYLQRIAEAWTPTAADCSVAPSVAGLGGPAKFWTTYAFDAAGNRKTEVLHGTTDTKRTYIYPAPGGAAGSQPHAVTQVVTTTGTTPTRTENYAYDKDGDMICRPTGAASNDCPAGTNGQVLDWTETGSACQCDGQDGDYVIRVRRRRQPAAAARPVRNGCSCRVAPRSASR